MARVFNIQMKVILEEEFEIESENVEPEMLEEWLETEGDISHYPTEDDVKLFVRKLLERALKGGPVKYEVTVEDYDEEDGIIYNGTVFEGTSIGGQDEKDNQCSDNVVEVCGDEKLEGI